MHKYIIALILLAGVSCLPTPVRRCESRDMEFWSIWYLIWQELQPPENRTISTEDIVYEADNEIVNPNKLYLHGNKIAFSEYDSKRDSARHYGSSGIQFLDISDLSNITGLGFIRIPGANEIAMKDDTMFTDSYDDLVSLDISDIKNPELKDLEENVLP